METRTPQFCSVCGSRLVANDTTTGFDPYTGEPNKSQSLHCPNPTVDVTGTIAKKTSYTYHPSWSVNSVGIWAQQ